jgi:hypothetical protein
MAISTIEGGCRFALDFQRTIKNAGYLVERNNVKLLHWYYMLVAIHNEMTTTYLKERPNSSTSPCTRSAAVLA